MQKVEIKDQCPHCSKHVLPDAFTFNSKLKVSFEASTSSFYESIGITHINGISIKKSLPNEQPPMELKGF